MATAVVSGAMLQCSFGQMPTPLTVTSQMKVTAGGQAATIQDMAPGVNIKPFGACSALSGVPCAMTAAMPWMPGNAKVMVGGKPALTSDCTLMCTTGGGTISIISPGQAKVMY